jgi:predicted RNA-binding protein with PIN domain
MDSAFATYQGKDGSAFRIPKAKRSVVANRQRGSPTQKMMGRTAASQNSKRQLIASVARMLLIDGYNLLHVTDLHGTGAAEGTLQGSRDALLSFLAKALNERERKQTTIVFDAAGAPPGLPKIVPYEGMTAQFARGYDDADALLEEIIEKHPAPKSLAVVSSDRRVQRAARHRGAKIVESQEWFDELRRRKKSVGKPSESKAPPSEDASYWIKQFAGADKIVDEPKSQKKAATKTDEFDNPFPPGYGDDLLAEGSKE